MSISPVLYKSFLWKLVHFGTTFILNVFLIRIFRPEIAAGYYSMLYYFSLLAVGCQLGLDTAFTYFLSRRELSLQRALFLLAVVVIGALAVFLAAGPWIYRHGVYETGSSLRFVLWGCAAIAGTILTSLSTAFFTAVNRNHIATRVSFGVAAAFLAVTIWSYFFLSRVVSAPLLLEAYFLYLLLQGLLLFAFGIRAYRRNSGETGRAGAGFTRVLHYSLFAYAINLVFFIASRAVVYLLPGHLAPVPAGNFLQVFKVIEYAGALAAFVYFPVMALVAARQADRTREMVYFLVRLSNTVVLIFVIVVMLTGSRLFPFVFGTGFDDMYRLFPWFVPGLFSICASAFFTAAFFGAGMLRYNAISAVIMLGGVLLAWWLLSDRMGAAGMALAFSIGNLLSLVFDILVFRRCFGGHWMAVTLVSRTDIKRIKHQLRFLLGNQA